MSSLQEAALSDQQLKSTLLHCRVHMLRCPPSQETTTTGNVSPQISKPAPLQASHHQRGKACDGLLCAQGPNRVKQARACCPQARQQRSAYEATAQAGRRAAPCCSTRASQAGWHARLPSSSRHKMRRKQMLLQHYQQSNTLTVCVQAILWRLLCTTPAGKGRGAPAPIITPVHRDMLSTPAALPIKHHNHQPTHTQRCAAHAPSSWAQTRLAG